MFTTNNGSQSQRSSQSQRYSTPRRRGPSLNRSEPAQKRQADSDIWIDFNNWRYEDPDAYQR